MAILKSEENALESYLELIGGELKSQPTASKASSDQSQTWQKFSLRAKAGSYSLVAAGEEPEIWLCRRPVDEIACLHRLVGEVLQHQKKEIVFEPAEPSFELHIKSTEEGGFTVVVWLDAGNATSGYYQWDAAGLRLYSCAEELSRFADQLKQEFLEP